MKVSELIKLLEDLKDKYGDLPTQYFDDVYGWIEINEVEFVDYSDESFIGIG